MLTSVDGMEDIIRLGVAFLLFQFCVIVGFIMGRMTKTDQVPPIIQKIFQKREQKEKFENPFFDAMQDEPENEKPKRIPTIED